MKVIVNPDNLPLSPDYKLAPGKWMLHCVSDTYKEAVIMTELDRDTPLRDIVSCAHFKVYGIQSTE